MKSDVIKDNRPEGQNDKLLFIEADFAPRSVHDAGLFKLLSFNDS